ncbi:MAG: LPXTG cell wall anchor domain-containing protein [Oscillospiraceae bacterium]|nr:LPXTG cell wall anchor domain-containing protein [Oscillospiraceae bacterium]
MMKAVHVVSSVLILLAFCLLAIIAIPANAFTTLDAIVQVDCMAVKDSQGMTYTIALDPLSDNAPKPTNDTIRVMEDGTGRFHIRITEPGTYKYKLYEKKGTNKHVQYDSTVYTVSVYVQASTNNDLVYSVSVTNGVSTTKMDRVEFENIVLGEKETGTTTLPVHTDIQTHTHDTQVTTAETWDIPDFSKVTDRQTTAPAITDTQVTTDTNKGETGTETSGTETVTETVATDPPEETGSSDPNPTDPDSPETTTTTTTSTIETTDTTQPPDESNPVKEYLTNVLTGDSTPIAFLAGGLGAALLLGTAAILVKKRKDE